MLLFLLFASLGVGGDAGEGVDVKAGLSFEGGGCECDGCCGRGLVI